VTEELWFVLVMWLVFIVLAWRMKNVFLFGLSSVTSILFGVTLMTQISGWVGLIVIFLGMYLLYVTMFQVVKKK
jgi:hypothetical protein